MHASYRLMMEYETLILVCLFTTSLANVVYALNCPAGTYLSTYGDKCNACPAGSFCPGDNTKQSCSAGYYASKVGSVFCTVCPVGHRCKYTNQSPKVCSKGQFQNLAGQTSCTWCKEGEYNIATGSTSCKICPVGHRCYYVDNRPIECRRGKFQDLTGQRSCKWCKEGEYNVVTGAKSCKICPVGHRCYYVDNRPIECRKGKFQDQTAQRTCKWCKGGQYNLVTGSTKCKTCPTGKRCPYVDAVPLPCKEKKYSPAGSLKCMSCPTGSFCPSSSTLPVTPSTDQVLKNQIHEAVSYAAEAYKDDNNTSTLDGLRLVDSDQKVHGFVKYKDDVIIVSFRGTVDLNDWFSNVKFFKRPYTDCTGCEVHTGFSNSYNSVRMQMLARVSYLSHAHPNSKIIVTGHSLGGAQATLAAAELTKSGGYSNVDLITFGSPRVGNEKFSEYVNQAVSRVNLRVTYKDDIVTVTPPQSTGYRHVGQEMHYIDQNTGFKLLPQTDVNYNRLSGSDHKIVNYENLK